MYKNSHEVFSLLIIKSTHIVIGILILPNLLCAKNFCVKICKSRTPLPTVKEDDFESKIALLQTPEQLTVMHSSVQYVQKLDGA